MPPPTGSVRLKLLSDGTELSQAHPILGVTITRAVDRIAAAQVILRDGDTASSDFALSAEDVLGPGRELEIRAGYGDQEQSLFKGLIVRHGIQARRGRAALLVIECRDKAMKMTAGRKSAVFNDSSDSDILSDLAGQYGLDADVASTSPNHKQMVQFHASDWDFLLQRARANGLLVFVEDGALRLAAPDTSGSAALTVTYGQELLELDLESDARDQLDATSAVAWDPAAQDLASGDGAAPAFSPPGNQTASDLAAVAGAGTVALRHGGALPEGELTAWAGARLQESRMALVRGRARLQGDGALKPGALIELAGVGQRFAGKAFVAGVRHEITVTNWETDVQLGAPLRRPGGGDGDGVEDRPAAGLLPGVQGLQIGVVTQITDDPDGEERIQIKLPLLAADGTVWARLASPDAGDGRGWVFRPEVDDEVIVGFLHDDPRFPVVLGQLPSSAKPTPLPAADGNPQKGLITREEIKLVFDDDKKEVMLQTPGGNKLTISDDAQGVQIEDQNGNKVTLSSDGIVLDSGSDLSLKAAGDVTIEGVNVKLKASAELKGEGSSGLEMSSSAIAKLKGSLVQIN